MLHGPLSLIRFSVGSVRYSDGCHHAVYRGFTWYSGIRIFKEQRLMHSLPTICIVTFVLMQYQILPFAPPSQVLSAMNFIRSCLFTSDGSRRKKLPPHSRNPFPPEVACFPYSAALPRFAAAGSPPPGSLHFWGFAPQCPGRRSLPPAPTRTAFRTVLQFLAGSLNSYFQRQLY